MVTRFLKQIEISSMGQKNQQLLLGTIFILD